MVAVIAADDDRDRAVSKKPDQEESIRFYLPHIDVTATATGPSSEGYCRSCSDASFQIQRELSWLIPCLPS
jgi:hypothetical protein